MAASYSNWVRRFVFLALFNLSLLPCFEPLAYQTAVLSTRPKIAELMLRLFGRVLHPELFDVCRSHTLRRGNPDQEGADGSALGGYEAKLEVTNAGHIVTWKHRGLTLCEVAASAHHPLPQKRQLMSHRLDREQHESVDCRGGVRYEVAFGLEVVSQDAFKGYQEELDLASLHQGAGMHHGAEPRHALLHRFEPSGRVGVGALSYLHAEARDRALTVHSLHTFPDDCAIVRCRSRFIIGAKQAEE